MFCPHESTTPASTKSEITCRSCWRKFANLGELLRDLSTQVAALQKAIRLLPVEEFVQVEYRDGQLLMDGTAVQLRGPETESECAIEWNDFIQRQAREDAELMADRFDL
jgi:hypothetical protein